MIERLPGLRCVIAWSERRNLRSIIGDEMPKIVPEAEMRRLGDDAFVVQTSITADELRDRLREVLSVDEGLVVFEFEAWSGYGNALDTTWLLARGH